MWAIGIWLVVLGQQFSDVPKGHWASAAVSNVTRLGYLNGDPTGAFRGDKPVTRYEFAVALDRFVRDVRAGLTSAPKGFGPKQGTKPATPSKPKTTPAGASSPLGAKRPGPTPAHKPANPATSGSAKALDTRLGAAPNHWAYKSLRHLYDGGFLPPKSPVFSTATQTLTARQVGLALGQIAVRLADMRADPTEPHQQ